MPYSQQQMRWNPIGEEKSTKRPIPEIAKDEEPAAKRPPLKSEGNNDKGFTLASTASAVMQVKQLQLPVPCHAMSCSN